MSSPPLPPDIARMMEIPPDPRPKILEEIATFLAEAPLYRTYKYDGDLWTQDHRARSVFSFPQVLRQYCDEGECKKIQTWERKSGSDLGLYKEIGDMFTPVTFQCRNCQRSQVTYFL